MTPKDHPVASSHPSTQELIAIKIYYQVYEQTQTDGDSVVYFRKADVVSAGDVFVLTGYPVIDLERGGSLEGEIEAPVA